MGSETTSTVNANAADLVHPEGDHLRLAKIVKDVERIAP